MPRLLGVDIPGRKRIEYALRYIHGIGPFKARQIVKASGVDSMLKADDLSPDDMRRITTELQHHRTEGDLRREVAQNIRRLIGIGSYRGGRHRRSLPVRGQRTRTNARTRKGPRRTVGAVRDRDTRAAIKKTD